jgi:hypothetical protein
MLVLAAIVEGRVHRLANGHDLREELVLCCGRVVDFVCADILVNGFANGLVESLRELGQ